MPLKLTIRPDGILLSLKVVPNSSRTRIAGEYAGGLKINIAQPPEAGAANKAVIALLAETLAVPSNSVEIVRGHTNPRKEMLIRGMAETQIRDRLSVPSAAIAREGKKVRIGRASLVLLVLLVGFSDLALAQPTQTLTFDGVLSEQKIPLASLAPNLPTDWSTYDYLVLEMRASSPHRFGIWLYTASGLRRVEFQPLGQNVWFRASIPLAYFQGMDKSGTDLASAYNRRSKTFWIMVNGPFGEINSVQAVGFQMNYPIGKPTIEIRSAHLSHADEGSDYLEQGPFVDEFGQWAKSDWPGKIHNQDELDKQLADEQKSWLTNADYGYDEYGGYKDTEAKATGFFRVEQINDRWWFVDPLGHLFLSTGINGTGAGFGGRPRNMSSTQPAPPDTEAQRTARRLESWGMTTGGANRPITQFLYWNLNRRTTFLGIPDVYSDEFAKGVDESANRQCTPRKNDPMILGYFVGNEPPWTNREDDVCKMILAGPDTPTKSKLNDFLSHSDTLVRRREFVAAAFTKYLQLICDAVRKYDPSHLILGIRFGGSPNETILRTGTVFDVCSINIYEYEPTVQLERAYRITGRPILLGEFHIGVPANGLGAGLVQARDQAQRALGYRYYVEQAASLPAFVGTYWFQWRDEPVLGRMDGENYNIGFVDCTNRPYPELVQAAQTTNKRLKDIHSGTILPINQKPLASDAGSPASPWD
jgi:uncharacterized protein (TIGR00251 family)